MPGNADPSRIYHDPALTDRRGDATGLVAFAFLFVLVGVFALAAFVLVSLPLAADPTPAPPATPGILATPRPSPTPTSTADDTASTSPSVVSQLLMLAGAILGLLAIAALSYFILGRRKRRSAALREREAQDETRQ